MVMLALFRQFAARTESSISLTLMLSSFFICLFSWLTALRGLVELDRVLVVVDEDIEVVAQDRRRTAGARRPA